MKKFISAFLTATIVMSISSAIAACFIGLMKFLVYIDMPDYIIYTGLILFGTLSLTIVYMFVSNETPEIMENEGYTIPEDDDEAMEADDEDY